MRFGELVAIARECKGWTLRDLERETGISNAYLSQIENFQVREPSFVKVIRIADALGLSLDRVAETARFPKGILRKRGVDAETASKEG